MYAKICNSKLQSRITYGLLKQTFTLPDQIKLPEKTVQ